MPNWAARRFQARQPISTSYIANEAERWDRVIRAAHVKPEQGHLPARHSIPRVGDTLLRCIIVSGRKSAAAGSARLNDIRDGVRYPSLQKFVRRTADQRAIAHLDRRLRSRHTENPAELRVLTQSGWVASIMETVGGCLSQGDRVCRFSTAGDRVAVQATLLVRYPAPNCVEFDVQCDPPRWHRDGAKRSGRGGR